MTFIHHVYTNLCDSIEIVCQSPASAKSFLFEFSKIWPSYDGQRHLFKLRVNLGGQLSG
jgi:hypothetical protein